MAQADLFSLRPADSPLHARLVWSVPLLRQLEDVPRFAWSFQAKSERHTQEIIESKAERSTQEKRGGVEKGVDDQRDGDRGGKNGAKIDGEEQRNGR